MKCKYKDQCPSATGWCNVKEFDDSCFQFLQAVGEHLQSYVELGLSVEEIKRIKKTKVQKFYFTKEQLEHTLKHFEAELKSAEHDLGTWGDEDMQQFEKDNILSLDTIIKLIKNEINRIENKPLTLNDVEDREVQKQALKNKIAQLLVEETLTKAKEMGLNVFIVTDEASGTHNRGNDAVRNARENHIKWEEKYKYEPKEN